MLGNGHGPTDRGSRTEPGHNRIRDIEGTWNRKGALKCRLYPYKPRRYNTCLQCDDSGRNADIARSFYCLWCGIEFYAVTSDWKQRRARHFLDAWDETPRCKRCLAPLDDSAGLDEAAPSLCAECEID